ncbi:hypothetical protein FB446DRAFT_788662 [Lentinula raphanica]|nr:hypothetical protein FB446DRAFT_788662 [Lentinula raphanica]
MFTALLALGAASSVVVSAVPIDTNSGPLLVPTSTTTSAYIPTSTSVSGAAVPKASLDDPSHDSDDVLPGVAPLSRSSDQHLHRRTDPKNTDHNGANQASTGGEPSTGGGPSTGERSSTNRAQAVPSGLPANLVPTPLFVAAPAGMTAEEIARENARRIHRNQERTNSMMRDGQAQILAYMEAHNMKIEGVGVNARLVPKDPPGPSRQ